MPAVPSTRPTFTLVHGAILVALIAAAIFAPIGAIALALYVGYLAFRYFRRS